MPPVKLSLALAVLLLIGVLAIPGVGLIDGTSQGGSGKETQPQRAFQAWREAALPLILRYRQTLTTAQTPTRALDIQTCVLTAEQARATLARLRATLHAQPPTSSDALRPLNTMLAQPSRSRRPPRPTTHSRSATTEPTSPVERSYNSSIPPP